LDSLASNIEFLTCFLHSPTGTEIDLLDYQLQNENIRLVDLGPHNSVPKRLLKSSSIKKIIKENCNNLDLMLIRAPSPLLPAVASASNKLPIVLLIVGDYLAGIDDLPQPKWRKELIRLWSWLNAQQQLKIARQSLTFVNSYDFFNRWERKVPILIETKTTTLSNRDFFIREDTCQKIPIRLLYTGRMDRAKGLLDILEAVQILVKSGVDIMFDLVGMQVKGDPVLEEITEKSKKFGLEKRIKYHGYFPLGPNLFQFYKQADIYVIASQASEGFPRTIWEAMAHSLPVIATRVGSIPDYVEGAALLISPRLPQDLAKAISQLISDQEIRKKNIRKGYLLAQQNTLEIRAKEMITHMEQYLDNVKHD
jgi:glycosyltransferase involved in cell wall biosynthesis